MTLLDDEERQALDNLLHFLVVRNETHTVYCVKGYASKPTQEDIEALRQELKEDESWSHVEVREEMICLVRVDDLIIEEATEEQARLHRNEFLKDPEFWL